MKNSKELSNLAEILKDEAMNIDEVLTLNRDVPEEDITTWNKILNLLLYGYGQIETE